MKCFIIVVGVLALLAMVQSQSDESGNTTVDPSDEGKGSSSPAPPPPSSPPQKHRPGPHGGSFLGFSFGIGNRRQPFRRQLQEEDSDGTPNPPRRFPLRLPVLFDFGSGNHFGRENFFSDDRRRPSSTTLAP